MNLESVDAQRVATPRAADRPAWGWSPKGIEREGKPAATPMKMWPICPWLCWKNLDGPFEIGRLIHWISPLSHFSFSYILQSCFFKCRSFPLTSRLEATQFLLWAPRPLLFKSCCTGEEKRREKCLLQLIRVKSVFVQYWGPQNSVVVTEFDSRYCYNFWV